MKRLAVLISGNGSNLQSLIDHIAGGDGQTGVDLEQDILAQMEFEPLIPAAPAPMDSRIFRDALLGLKH